MEHAVERKRKRRLVAYFIVVLAVLISMPFSCYSEQIQGLATAEGRAELRSQLDSFAESAAATWEGGTSTDYALLRASESERRAAEARVVQGLSEQRRLYEDRISAGETLGGFSYSTDYRTTTLEPLPGFDADASEVPQLPLVFQRSDGLTVEVTP